MACFKTTVKGISLLSSLFLFVCGGNAAITFEFPGDYTIPAEGGGSNGPSGNPSNSTGLRWEVSGWRFYADLGWTKFTGDSNAKTSVTETSEGYLHEAVFSRPDLYLLPPKGNDAMGVGYNWETFSEGGDGNPHDVSVLLKLSAKGVMPLPIDSMDAIEPADLSGYVSSFSNYYDDSYRYLDTLGIRGGKYSGGFYDTWNGETQVQIPVPADTFSLSNTPVWISPATTDGPNYWMALAMLQEYFNADMQFQMTIGFKETMAGLASTTDPIPYLAGKNNNDDGAFGPFEVESFTYVTGSMYYPQFFPKYTLGLSNANSEYNFGVEVTDVKDFTVEYCGPLSGTYLNQPLIIGCMLGSHHTFRRIYDLLSNTERMCFKEYMEEGVDGEFARAALGVMYNRGITAPGENTFGDSSLVDSVLDIAVYKNYLSDPDANEYIPMGNSEYRHHLLENFHRLEEYSKMALNDKSIPIYDEWITEAELEAFFFGEGGSVATQGLGGLAVHFNVENRQKMWDDLMSAFNDLSEHWNQSPRAVSFRYDWLTLLRVVKNHFPVNYKPRPYFGEAAGWMEKRSLNEGDMGCDGAPVDKTFPHMEKTGSAFKDGYFIAQFLLEDDQAVKELIWTRESDWSSWSSTEQFTGSSSKVWTLKVASSAVSEGDTIWVGVVDSSGNAEVQTHIVTTMGEVGTKAEIMKHKSSPGMKIVNQGRMLRITNIKEGSVAVRIFDLRGRELFNKVDDVNFGVAQLQIPQLAKGGYVMRIETGDITRSLRMIID